LYQRWVKPGLDVRQQRGHVRHIERRNRPGALAADERKADRRATPPAQVALAVLEDPAQLGVTALVALVAAMDDWPARPWPRHAPPIAPPMGTALRAARAAVPIQLLRAGVKLVGVIPVQAQEHINRALQDRGLPFDLTQIKPENLDEIIVQLRELTLDIDQAAYGDAGAVKVRIFCE
jgi:hypothetical protein